MLIEVLLKRNDGTVLWKGQMQVEHEMRHVFQHPIVDDGVSMQEIKVSCDAKPAWSPFPRPVDLT